MALAWVKGVRGTSVPEALRVRIVHRRAGGLYIGIDTKANRK